VFWQQDGAPPCFGHKVHTFLEKFIAGFVNHVKIISPPPPPRSSDLVIFPRESLLY
jgi:hypothetical protein